jgi:hypothetical protein
MDLEDGKAAPVRIVAGSIQQTQALALMSTASDEEVGARRRRQRRMKRSSNVVLEEEDTVVVSLQAIAQYIQPAKAVLVTNGLYHTEADRVEDVVS